MTARSPDQAQSTQSLLSQAKQEIVNNGELIRLLLAGIPKVDSWLIENRILPALRARNTKTFQFTLVGRDKEAKSVSLVPLPDGAAFACSTSGQWFALEEPEATSFIQHIGFRYAPENRWEQGFQAELLAPDQPPVDLKPFDVASTWGEITGAKPSGFEAGALDEVEALGLKLLELIFETQGELGL